MGHYNGRSPHERRATTPIQRDAIASGAIPHPTTCSICRITPDIGSDNPVWLHDERYDRPLEAYHVCRRCHRALHNRFDDPAPWLKLVADYGNGTRWFDLLSLDPASQRQPFALTYPNGLPRD